MDIDMDKLNVELEEFKKYVHDKSFKVEVRSIILYIQFIILI